MLWVGNFCRWVGELLRFIGVLCLVPAITIYLAVIEVEEENGD